MRRTEHTREQFWEYVQGVLHENDKYRAEHGLTPITPQQKQDDAAA
jgi:hypothetical protein